jgi:hypothetical protein
MYIVPMLCARTLVLESNKFWATHTGTIVTTGLLLQWSQQFVVLLVVDIAVGSFSVCFVWCCSLPYSGLSDVSKTKREQHILSPHMSYRGDGLMSTTRQRLDNNRETMAWYCVGSMDIVLAGTMRYHGDPRLLASNLGRGTEEVISLASRRLLVVKMQRGHVQQMMAATCPGFPQK